MPPNESGVKFGPKKLGKAAYDLAVTKAVVVQKYGPKKFGARKIAEMHAAVTQAEQVVDDEKAPAVEGKAVDTANVTGTTSIKQIDQALQDNPAVYEEMYALEMRRIEGPRKGAMRLFMAAEMARNGGPREDRMAEIEAFLKPKTPKK